MKPALQDDFPVCQGHLEVEGLLPVLLGVVEGELVELAEFAVVPDLLLQGREFRLEFLDGITAERLIN